MPTPLSGSTYGSRFDDDINLFSYADTFNYKNMSYHGFYSAASLQAQELNELQEQCQTQNTVYCNLLKNWLVYINVDGVYKLENGISGGFLTEDDTVIPENPNYIQTISNGLNVNYTYAKGWYFKRYPNGLGQYVYLPDINTTSIQFSAGNKYSLLNYLIQKRIANSRNQQWQLLRDNSPTTLDIHGSHRIQDYLLINDGVIEPIGACNTSNGCVTITQLQCVAAGGEYQGDGSNCQDFSILGACCINEFCSTTTESQCVAAGGEYQGDGSQCTPTTCSSPPAAQQGAVISGGLGLNNVIFYTTGFTSEIKSISGWDPDPENPQGGFVHKGVANALTNNEGTNGFDLTPPPGITGVLQIEQGYGFVVALIEKNGIRSLTAWGHPKAASQDTINNLKQPTSWFMEQVSHYQQSGKRLDGIQIKKIACGSRSVCVLFENGEVTSYNNDTNSNPTNNEANHIWSPIGKIPIPVKNNATYISGWTGYVAQTQGSSLSTYIVSSAFNDGCFGNSNSEYDADDLDGISWDASLSWRQYRFQQPNCGRNPQKDSPSGWTLTGAPNDYYFDRESVGKSGANYSHLGAWHIQENDRILMAAGMTGYFNSSTLPKDIRSNFPGNSVFGISNKKYKDISAGRSHFILLTEDGTIETWGWNYYYTVTGSGKHPNGYLREGSGFTLGREENGWGTTNDDGIFVPRPWPPALEGDDTASFVKTLKNNKSSVKGIGSSYYNNAVILPNGDAFVWDRNEWGESSSVPSGPFKQISGGYHHFVGLKDDGTVVCWGENNDGECAVPNVLTIPNPSNPCVYVFAQRRMSFALQQNGDLWGWGNTTERKFGYRGFTSGQKFNTEKIIITPPNPPSSGSSQLEYWCDIVADRIDNVSPEDKSRQITFQDSYQTGISWAEVASTPKFDSITNFGQPLVRTWKNSSNQDKNIYDAQTYTRKFTLQDLDTQKLFFPGWMTEEVIADRMFTDGCTLQAITRIRSERDVSQGYWMRISMHPLVLSLYHPQITPTTRTELINKINDVFDKVSQYTDTENGKIKFQRKGWTIGFRDTPSGLCENSTVEDGAYLANGWITLPVCFGLHIIEKIPQNLKPGINSNNIQKLRTALEYELFNLVLNWKDQLGWYTKGSIPGGPSSGQPNTNQWIEPNSAMIAIPLVLEDQKYLAVYNLGVTLLLSGLISCRSDGSFSEGYAYSEQTAQNILNLLLLMKKIPAEKNENRHLQFQGWIGSHWNWLIDHHLPGNFIANYSDNRANMIRSGLENTITDNQLISGLAFYEYFNRDTKAIQNLKIHFPGSNTNTSLRAIQYEKIYDDIPSDQRLTNYNIDNFKIYNNANFAVWRQHRLSPSQITSSSQPNPSFCIWMKGSNPTDGHRHADFGQFSIYSGNRVVILESGINYNALDLIAAMSGVSGHNIFQQFAKPVAQHFANCPVAGDINASSGNISISLTDAYQTPIQGITRDILWGLSGSTEFVTTVKDRISFDTAQQTNLLEMLRFHTGFNANITVSPPTQTRSCIVTWSGVTMGITSNIDINVSTESASNATLHPDGNITTHKVIVVKSNESQPVENLSFTTKIHTRKLSTDRS